MIEQYAITTPARYNFPLSTSDTSLPQRFTELSLHSLKNLHDPDFQLNQYNAQQISNAEFTNKISLRPQLITLKPRREPCIVAAVDTSSIKISQTDRGILAAVRGAIVWKQNNHYKYTRFGPFVFHLTEENKSEVYRMLQRGYSPATNGDDRCSYLTLAQVPMKIASLLERWLQARLSETFSKGLILFDGSLTCGVADTPIRLMKQILATARKRDNVVMAFSKMTNLRINGHLITEFLPKDKPPYLLEITGVETKPPVLLLGNVYVAHFCTERYAFRMDVDKEIGLQRQAEAAEKLLWNESLSQSYPETLRLAHILCTFTANEVIAMQHFAVRKCGVRIVDRIDMHKLLFGPFGRGEYFS